MLIGSAVTFGTAANGIHQLALRERRLIVEKRRLKGGTPNGEREYVRDYRAFAKGEMAAALDAGKVVLTQLVQSGLNDVLSQHLMLSIKDGKLLTTSLRAAAAPHLVDQQFSFLVEHCGFSPKISSLVWTAFVNITSDISLDVLLPGQLSNNPGSIGSGVPLGGGTVINIPIQKGVGIAISDLIFLATTTTTDYVNYLEGAGVPVYGTWLAVSASRLAGGSEILWAFGAMGLCVLGAGLLPGTLVAAVCEIVFLALLFWMMDALPCGGPASFVDP